MSFKCSVFGHKFGDPVVDREREEAGSEVVITIRETQTCSRCGEERIVSENKEVTTLETPTESPVGGGSPATSTPESAGAIESDEAIGEESSHPEATADTASEGGDGEEPASDADDATIIEESPEESIVEEAEPEEVPTADEPGSAAGQGGADGTEDDAVILEEESAAEDDGDSGRQPGEWPEEPADDGPDWEPPTDVKSAAETDVADEQASEVEPTSEAVTVPEGVFRCSECGFTTDVESSSLRAGDFCPDCHTGTLVHDPDQD